MNAQNKLKYGEWRNMPLHEKTKTYFSFTNCALWAQTMFCNDWRKAFTWFEEVYTS